MLTPTEPTPGEAEPLSRRRFLAAAGAAGAAAAVTGACGTTPEGPKHVATLALPDGPAAGAADTGPLVLVTLVGGNDALNTVVPVDDSRYLAARGDLAVDPASALDLGEGFGLHPALTCCKAIWDGGRLAVVHGVGFDGLDRSHFHCMDVWESGGGEAGATGWVGRWLDLGGGDPLAAVVVGTRLPLLARGERTVAAVVPPGPFELALPGALDAGFRAQVAADEARNALEARAARSGADLLDVAARIAVPLADHERRHSLTHQLGTVASLIAAGLPTRIYVVEQRGYDTHASQADEHAALLRELDAALGAFLYVMGGRATVVVYSEFGRRVEVNGSAGTDHGGAGTVLVGGRVAPGHHGEPPPLDDLVDGDLRTTTQVASVYADLLEGVLGTPAADVLGSSPARLGLIG